MRWFSRPPVVPVLRLNGPIGVSTPLKPGLTLTAIAGAIDRAFKLSKLPSVAISINSPGGSPVQSHLIYKRIRQLAEERKKRVYVFCEDVAASGGYFLAVAGDEIYADPSSIVGSIGVISSTFGLDKAIERLGIERRVYTSGTSKSFLDPFKPEKAEDVARLRAVQEEVHRAFIAVVKERRGSKLPQDDTELFTGAFWPGQQAVEMGLVDGIADMRSHMQKLHGDKVRLKLVSPSSGGLITRLLRPGSAAPDGLDAAALTGLAQGNLAEDIITALEKRALWARFGL